MKINPKIAKTPEDLKSLEFKKMKTLIKKELKRLEKYTSAEAPTQCILLGSFDYQDKAGMALPLFGIWKGKFKDYAKKEVVKNDAGVIGTAHYAGVGEDGQKVLQISIAKGKGKGKKTLFHKNLKKLIPQATYNVVFSELDENAFDTMAEKLESAPELEEENFEEDNGTEEDLIDYKKVLASNFKELMDSFAPVKSEVLPRIRSNQAQEDDRDTILNLEDLAEEWLELHKAAPIDTQILFQPQQQQVAKLKTFIDQALARLNVHEEGEVDGAGTTAFDMSFIDNLMTLGEKPDERFEIGLNKDAMSGIFIQQGLNDNCDAAARMAVYQYLHKKKVLSLDIEGIRQANGISTNGKFLLYAERDDKKPNSLGLNDYIESKDYEISKIFGAYTMLSQEVAGKYVQAKSHDKAIAYIDANLKNGIPVIVGVSIKIGAGNADGTSEHFIVLVGKSGKGYYYIDPAITNGGTDFLDQNILEAREDGSFRDSDSSVSWIKKHGGDEYLLTTVAIYPKDKEQMSKMSSITVFEINGLVKDNNSNKDDIIVVQTLLVKAGYNLGSSGTDGNGADGDYGKLTHNALVAFQTKNGISPIDGEVAPGSKTWFALKGEIPSPITPEDIELNYHSTVKKLSLVAEATLRVLLAQAGETAVQIINTYRSPEEQAKVMHANIKALGAKANKKLYRNPAAATKVIEAYEKALGQIPKRTEEIEIGLLLQGINLVGADKLSGHCNGSNPAIDILPASIKNRSKFEVALKKSGKLAKFVAPPKDSSYHLELK